MSTRAPYVCSRRDNKKKTFTAHHDRYANDAYEARSKTSCPTGNTSCLMFRIDCIYVCCMMVFSLMPNILSYFVAHACIQGRIKEVYSIKNHNSLKIVSISIYLVVTGPFVISGPLAPCRLYINISYLLIKTKTLICLCCLSFNKK